MVRAALRVFDRVLPIARLPDSPIRRFADSPIRRFADC